MVTVGKGLWKITGGVIMACWLTTTARHVPCEMGCQREPVECESGKVFGCCQKSSFVQ